MILYYKIKAAFIILVMLSLYSICSSIYAQNIVSLKPGENKLAEKEIEYERKLGIKVTPKIKYDVDEEKNFEESLEISFTANWIDPRDGTPKDPDDNNIFIIYDPDEFRKKCNESKSCKYDSKDIETSSGEIKRTIEFKPNYVIKYLKQEPFESFNASSTIIKTEISGYNNEVITLEVIFYLGTKSSTGFYVSKKSRLCTWEFQLPSTRPVCIEKDKYYKDRFDKIRPKQQLQILEDKLAIGKELNLVLDSLGEYVKDLYGLKMLKDSIKDDLDIYECKEFLNPLVRNIDDYLNKKESVEELMEQTRQLMDSSQKTIVSLSSSIILFDENVDLAQRLYRDLKKLQWDFKETQVIDSTLISDKISILDKLRKRQDSLYNYIIENGKENFKIKLNFQDFNSYYEESFDIAVNMYPDNKEIVAASTHVNKPERQIKNDPVQQKGTPFFFYLIPILSFILGVVAFKYMGQLKKAMKIKKKVKP